MEEITLDFPPWLDLPEPLAELILERLPLVDYIHFAAVCPKWRSILRGHRLRHAPHPPPMANQLPWLAPLRLNDRELKFYSLSDRKYYRIPILSSLYNFHCLASCRGWQLLLQDNDDLSVKLTLRMLLLFDPITTTQVLLPSLWFILSCRIVGAMSAPPTDPGCVVLLVYSCYAFLYRPDDHCTTDWTVIPLTGEVFAGSAIYCGGKFYYSECCKYELYVIDPFLQEPASPLVMRHPYEASTYVCRAFLQEIGGELFLVQTLHGSDDIKWFRVSKANLSWQEWVKVETIGDHTLFHYGDSSVLLSAASVGCKRNSIYACKDFFGLDVCEWGSFDLDTGGWTEEDLPMHGFFGAWILPTLDSVNPARASD